MSKSGKNVLVVNVMYWIVAASIHPVASLLTAKSGEPPKIFGVLIPIMFLGLAFGSTVMIARAMGQQKTP